MNPRKPRIIRTTVMPPKKRIDCMALKRTKLFVFSVKKKMRPVTQPQDVA